MSKYVSITGLTPASHPDYHDLEGSESPLLWDMNFPDGVDAERITVNTFRLRTIHEAGSAAVSFVESYDKTSDEDQGTEAEERSIGLCLDPFECLKPIGEGRGNLNLNATFGKSAITHMLNGSVLEAQVAKRKEETEIESERLWAEMYDEAIRSSMRQGLHKHLMGRKSNLPKPTIRGAYASGPLLAMAIAGPLGLWPEWAAAIAGAIYGVGQAAPFAWAHGRLTRDQVTLEKRWSVLPHTRQPDRYLAAAALTRMPGLITVAS